eukprot:scaffold26408_cov101-Isochrysis_galbana.AAC.3
MAAGISHDLILPRSVSPAAAAAAARAAFNWDVAALTDADGWVRISSREQMAVAVACEEQRHALEKA